MVVWASAHHDESHHNAHVHSDAMISGVFYANIPPGSGGIVFSDPRGVNPYHPEEQALPPFDAHRMAPNQGDLFLFPPW